jgi:hypothetical protein
MKNIRLWAAACALLLGASACGEQTTKEVDVCIYGGTSAGVIAAYTAQKNGKSVLLVEPGTHLGGMSSGGLGFTDIGNKYVVQGLALDFYRRLGKHYGKLEQWIFEPRVAEGIFNDYIRGANIEVWYNAAVLQATKSGSAITEVELAGSRRVRAKVFIDCSYEGDLMAQSGVSYTVGREANAEYGETFNGVQLMNRHQFPDGIDPYVVKGDTASGLLRGISPAPVLPNGTGDSKVQAYNFRICLTNVPENRVPITRPDRYDSSRYELLLRFKEQYPWRNHSDVFIWSAMPNGKTDINNFGGFSTDVIGENFGYANASYEERARIWQLHEDYTKGLLYFVGHDLRIPENIRHQMLEWGYPKDEYVDNQHWSHQLYVREARRMLGETVMTQHHCQGHTLAADGIAWAAYTMDSHNCDRHVVNGMVKNEGNVEEGGFAPYPIAYSAITPKRDEASNLLVPVCLSASHIAYGSIRMEPVFMVIGQSAAIAACQAIDRHSGVVQQVDAKAVWDELRGNPLADGSLPEMVVDNNHAEQVSTQGAWRTTPDGWKAYGADYLSIDPADRGTVRYTPSLVRDERYTVYAYVPKIKNAASHLSYSVFDGAMLHEVKLDAEALVVEGQTSGEWVSLGSYQLPAGNAAYVELSNQSANGAVAADAVLFIPSRQGES